MSNIIVSSNKGNKWKGTEEGWQTNGSAKQTQKTKQRLSKSVGVCMQVSVFASTNIEQEDADQIEKILNLQNILKLEE